MLDASVQQKSQDFKPQWLKTTFNTSIRAKEKRNLEIMQSMWMETVATADRKQDCSLLGEDKGESKAAVQKETQIKPSWKWSKENLQNCIQGFIIFLGSLSLLLFNSECVKKFFNEASYSLRLLSLEPRRIQMEYLTCLSCRMHLNRRCLDSLNYMLQQLSS